MFHLGYIRVFKLLFLVVFLFSGLEVSAQNKNIEKIIKPAFKQYYGLPRASVYLHLNKSIYSKGEHLWFKGYLYNRVKSTPFKEPLNIYVGIYDEAGKQIKKELFISKEGISQGQIKIDSTFSTGLYYLKATTSWMRNFKEDDSYVQQFRVLSDSISAQAGNAINKLDVQFLPEGGHLVSGVQATMGVKVLNESGFGEPGLNGYLMNKVGDTVANFNTNRFGLAKFEFLPKISETYHSKLIDRNGNSLKFLLPNIEEAGVTMSVKKLSLDRILILLGTNESSNKEIAKKPYSLIFHRDGLLKHMPVYFSKGENYVSYILDSGELQRGMNIITLIDNNGKPLAERLVFNASDMAYGELNMAVSLAQNDSVELNLFNNKKTDSLQFLSASILPSGTIAYQHKKNMLSTFLLSPYVKGFIEYPSYYFSSDKEIKEDDLDLLLLTQGWSKYNWNNIFNNPPVKNYDFKTGVDLYGRLNSRIAKNENLVLYPSNLAEPIIIKLEREAKGFSLKNYYFENESELKLTLADANGNLTRPNLYIRLDDGVTIDRIYDTKKENFEINTSFNRETFKLNNFILPNKTIVLDEAVVIEKKVKESYVTSQQIAEYRLTKVTKTIESSFPQLLDLIRFNGYDVWEEQNIGYDRIRITTKRPTGFRGKPSPVLYIDDIYQPDFNMLQDFSTQKIESFIIDRTGNGEPGAGGGVIRVYTRKGSYGAEDSSVSNSQSTFFKHIVKKGFSPVKEFYVPKYNSYTDDSFNNFGTIHWEPNILLNGNRKATFSFDSKGWTEFIMFIEGMGTDGTLFSTSKIIKLNPGQ